jgi:hypothetical protein
MLMPTKQGTSWAGEKLTIPVADIRGNDPGVGAAEPDYPNMSIEAEVDLFVGVVFLLKPRFIPHPSSRDVQWHAACTLRVHAEDDNLGSHKPAYKMLAWLATVFNAPPSSNDLVAMDCRHRPDNRKQERVVSSSSATAKLML